MPVGLLFLSSLATFIQIWSERGAENFNENNCFKKEQENTNFLSKECRMCLVFPKLEGPGEKINADA